MCFGNHDLLVLLFYDSLIVFCRRKDYSLEYVGFCSNYFFRWDSLILFQVYTTIGGRGLPESLPTCSIPSYCFVKMLQTLETGSTTEPVVGRKSYNQ